MSRFFNINSYIPTEEEKFFIDANVLIYLYNPIHHEPSYERNIYSNFLAKIIRTRAQIYTSSLILSEFINTIAKREFNRLNNEKVAQQLPKIKFKENFRPSPAGAKTLRLISQAAKSMLKNLKKIEDNFTTIDTNQVLNDLNNCDFNDKYFMHLCEKEGLKIVTNDGDFASCDLAIDIITANTKLL